MAVNTKYNNADNIKTEDELQNIMYPIRWTQQEKGIAWNVDYR